MPKLIFNDREIDDDLGWLDDEKRKSTYQVWFQAAGIKPDSEEAEELKSYLANSSRIFDLLKQIIGRRYQHIKEQQINVDRPNWQERQLHYNGYLQALRDIHFLTPTEGDK